MRRRRPDPDQALFRWVWDADPRDSPPDPTDESPPAPGPLRRRILARRCPSIATELWGSPVIVRKAGARRA